MAKRDVVTEEELPAPPPLIELVVLETDAGRTIRHIPGWLAAKQPHLLIEGTSWYHKTEDAEGRWVYRKD